MRHYLYISRRKVDMLAAQLSKGFFRRLAATLKLDARVASVSLEHKPADENVYSQLARIERVLAKQDKIGSPLHPKAYIHATLPMHASVMQDESGVSSYLCLIGEDRGRKIGLFGSAEHILGAAPPEASCRGFSAYLLNDIAQALRSVVPSEDLETTIRSSNPAYFLDWIRGAMRGDAIVTQTFEFLAHRIASGSDFFVGTPLYVAFAENDDKMVNRDDSGI